MRTYFSFGLPTITWRCIRISPFLLRIVTYVAPGNLGTSTSVFELSANTLRCAGAPMIMEPAPSLRRTNSDLSGVIFSGGCVSLEWLYAGEPVFSVLAGRISTGEFACCAIADVADVAAKSSAHANRAVFNCFIFFM